MDILTDLGSTSTSITLTSCRPNGKEEDSSTLTNYSSFMVSTSSSAEKNTPLWQSEPTDYSKPPSSSLVTSGPSFMSSSTNLSHPHTITNLTATLSPEPMKLPSRSEPTSPNMVPLPVSKHLSNFPPRIFIYIDDPLPLVRFQVLPAFPFQVSFPYHDGPPFIRTEVHPTFQTNYQIVYKINRLMTAPPMPTTSIPSLSSSYLIFIRILPKPANPPLIFTGNSPMQSFSPNIAINQPHNPKRPLPLTPPNRRSVLLPPPYVHTPPTMIHADSSCLMQETDVYDFMRRTLHHPRISLRNLISNLFGTLRRHGRTSTSRFRFQPAWSRQ